MTLRCVALRFLLLGALLAAFLVAASARAETVHYQLYAETHEGAALTGRLVAGFDVTPLSDTVDRVHVGSVRRLGSGQRLLAVSHAGLRFDVDRRARQTALSDIPGLGPLSEDVGLVVRDILMLYAANDAAALKRVDAGADDAAAQPREIGSTVTLDAPLLGDWSQGEAIPVARDCLAMSDTLMERDEGMVLYHTQFRVPLRPCLALAGLARERVDNAAWVAKAGDAWWHASGTRVLEVRSKVNPATQRIISALIIAREDMAVRPGCTRHGALCQAPVPLSVERHVEISQGS